MNILEKAAYLKGMVEGVDIKKDSKEEKILSEMVKLIGDICEELYMTREDVVEINELIDAIDEDLAELEDRCYDDSDCCSDEEYVEEFDDYFGVRCPKCGKEHFMKYTDLNEDELDKGIIYCPDCNEKIDLDECLILDDMCNCGDEEHHCDCGKNKCDCN